jgi:outer membrane lipoprotein LolB
MAANAQIQHWQISGKIGLRDGSSGHSGYLNWQQCGNQFDIRLSGPLGQGTAHLYGDSRQAKLVTNDQQLFQARSAAELLEQQLGWSLPVEQLFYWLRGIPSPDYPYQSYSHQTKQQAASTGLGFEQNHWQLSFLKFAEVDGYQLPSKIIAQKTPYKVTLVISQWQLPTNCEISE